MGRIANYPPLRDWLDTNEARCLWQIGHGSSGEHLGENVPAFYIEAYEIRSRVVIVQIHARQGGWNVWTDYPSVKIDETLRDADTRIAAGAPKVSRG